MTKLNRDQVVEILRLISCENLVCDRKEFITPHNNTGTLVF